MARYDYSRSSYSSKGCSRSSSRGGYTKSYNNSTRQTCAQRYSPTKTCKGTWYDANGSKVNDTKAYFSTIEKNGKYWKEC